jgi:tRNA-binding EMAP/Myf-like protein
MRGITSEAMILCATDKDTGKVELLKIPENAKVGDRVDYEGYEKEDADERVSPKKLEKLLPLFGTDAEKNVIFDKTHILNISGAAVTSSFASSNVK